MSTASSSSIAFYTRDTFDILSACHVCWKNLRRSVHGMLCQVRVGQRSEKQVWAANVNRGFPLTRSRIIDMIHTRWKLKNYNMKITASMAKEKLHKTKTQDFTDQVESCTKILNNLCTFVLHINTPLRRVRKEGDLTTKVKSNHWKSCKRNFSLSSRQTYEHINTYKSLNMKAYSNNYTYTGIRILGKHTNVSAQ